jgi:sugar phosphate isomerase/epimerase
MPFYFSANLTTLYPDVPFLDRFALAAADGFKAMEVWFPYEAGIEAVKSRLEETGLNLALFNLPPGDQAGEWGTLGHPSFRLQYDVYHAQKSEGNLISTLQTYISWIDHIQIADVPGRNQPGPAKSASGTSPLRSKPQVMGATSVSNTGRRAAPKNRWHGCPGKREGSRRLLACPGCSQSSFNLSLKL